MAESTTSGKILALPDRTSSHLRSSIILPSLPSILTELVQNALDAHSTSIQLSFNLDSWTIKCSDDGHGFSWSDLSQLGRYSTSKLGGASSAGGGRGWRGLDQVETFGFRGEALISMADVGLLEVETKRDYGLDNETYQLVVRDGIRLKEGVSKTKRNGGGTTVTIRDIFYKWPVRRRPLSTPSAKLSLVSSLRTAFATLALLHPLVSFTLTDNSDDQATGANRLISVVKSKEGVLGRWKQLWGRAGVEEVIQFSEVESHQGDGLGVEGFFSLSASHSKARQYIYVNSRPLSSSSELHKLVNNLFSASSFARHATSHLTSSATSSSDELDGTKISRKSSKKVVERHPIFVLNLTCPAEVVDVTLEPEKRVVEFQDTKRVLHFIEKVVKTFLRQNGFLNTLPTAPKSVTPIPTNLLPSTFPTRKLSSSLDKIISLPEERLKTPRIRLDQQNLVIYPEKHDARSSSQITPVTWIDPITHQKYLIDPRTGNSWNPSLLLALASPGADNEGCRSCDAHKNLDPEEGGARKNAIVDKSSLRRSLRTEEELAGEVVPEWLMNTLETWENPVLPLRASPTVSALPHLTRPTTHDPTTPTPHSRSHQSQTYSYKASRADQRSMDAFFRTPSSPSASGGSTSITREMLSKARFIAQVDKKFLLVALPASSSSTLNEEVLVIIDQHAASERVRVEKFLEELCGGGKVEEWEFEEKVPVLVSAEEARVVRENVAAFAKWGVRVEVEDVAKGEMEVEGEGASYEQVWLKSVPMVVCERLKVEKKLKQELVRSFVAKLVEERGMGSAGGAKKETTWVERMRRCPPVLVELVNSKACRGAVMFNDELTDDQARRLITKLATTSFPFQCAHGRPSLSPLLRLPSSMKKKGQGEKRKWDEQGIDWSRLCV